MGAAKASLDPTGSSVLVFRRAFALEGKGLDRSCIG